VTDPNLAEDPVQGQSARHHRAAWITSTALLALAIFVVDTFTSFGIAVAVLYVIVVLLSDQFTDSRGVILVSAVCGLLTVIGFAAGHGDELLNEAMVRCLISLAAIGIAASLTIRGQRMFNALEESEARNRMFLNVSAVGFWRVDVRRLNEMFGELRTAGITDLRDYVATDPDFVVRAMSAVPIVDVNKKAIELLGARTRSELVGRPVVDIWPPGQHDAFVGSINAGFRGESGFQAEARIRALDGRDFDALFCMAAPSEIRARGMVLVAVIDITEQVKARTLIASMQSDLAHSARLSMLGEFTASIAHEINQPLAAITTNGEAGLRWLGRAEPNIEESRTLLARIIADARRAAQIIARIRNMATKRSSERVAHPLNPVIDETVRFLRHETRANGVEVSLDLAADLPDVPIDRVQIQQVLSNLIVNAMQALAESKPQRPRITISSRTGADDQVLIEVTDNGAGIAPENRERLFESFFTTKSGGMGLGLPISRSIVETHGGTIGVENRSGEGGACFTISLPSRAAPALAEGRR
jgi:PAS domain S-box-containing protein